MVNTQEIEITKQEQIQLEMLEERKLELVRAGYTAEYADMLATMEQNICQGTEKERREACMAYADLLAEAEENKKLENF